MEVVEYWNWPCNVDWVHSGNEQGKEIRDASLSLEEPTLPLEPQQIGFLTGWLPGICPTLADTE